jgi:tetratricopeptide (TPR) repeat protein
MDDQARAYYRAGAFTQAAQAFEKAFELKAKSGRLFNAGRAYEQAGDKRKASELYGRYLDRESSGDKATEARARKAKLDTEIAEEDRAAAEASAALEKKKQVLLHVDTAQGHLRTGSYIAAAASFEEAFQVAGDPEFIFDKAEALRLGQQRAEAIAAYRRYQREAPTGHSIAEARKRQRELENPLTTNEPTTTTSVPVDTSTAEPLASTSTTAAPTDGGNRFMRISGLVVGGIGVALLGTSGVFAIQASSIESDLNGLDPMQGDRWSAKEEDRYRDGKDSDVLPRPRGQEGEEITIPLAHRGPFGRQRSRARRELLDMRSSLASVALLAFAGGCFDPQIRSGLPCGEGDSCPDGQFCNQNGLDQNQNPAKICEPINSSCVGPDCPDAAVASVTFGNGDPFNVGPQAHQLLVADVNKDGLDDIIVSGGDGIYTILSGGQGYQNPPPIYAGMQSRGVAVGDVNNDDFEDIVFLFDEQPGDQRVSVALKQAGGSFDTPMTTLLTNQGGADWENIQLAHFNDDNNLDLLLYTQNSIEAAQITQNNPLNAFPDTTSQFFIPEGTRQIVVGDIDLDTHDDLIAVSGTGLHASARIPGAGYSNSMSHQGGDCTYAVMTDVSGDSRTDMLVSSERGLTTHVRDGEVEGFASQTDFDHLGLLVRTQFDAGDLDGNGTVDVVTKSGQVFLGTPGNPGQFFLSTTLNVRGNDNPIQAVVGNFNGDTFLDVAVLHSVAASDGYVTMFPQVAPQ